MRLPEKKWIQTLMVQGRFTKIIWIMEWARPSAQSEVMSPLFKVPPALKLTLFSCH